MKALILEANEQPLVFKDVAVPTVSTETVLVNIHTAGLNHRDVWIQKGQYAGLKYPIILGSDGAGTVVEVGNQKNKDLVNQTVIINPSLEWGDNEGFQGKNYTILGLPQDGTFTEYVAVPSKNVYLKPQHLDIDQAAALPLAGLTAYRALVTRGKVQPNEKVLITGIGGGVALFAMQFAVALGAKVYVTSGSDEKLERVKKMGVVQGVNYKKEGWAKDLQKEVGNFDLIIDGAGGQDFTKLIDLAISGGRIVSYGATRGAIPEFALTKIFWKQLTISGSTMGSDKDFAEMLQLVNKHKIIPILDKVFLLAYGERAMQRMEQGEQFGKIVLDCRPLLMK